MMTTKFGCVVTSAAPTGPAVGTATAITASASAHATALGLFTYPAAI